MAMRFVARVVAVALLALFSVVPPARGADVSSLDGHWRCTGPNLPPTERSFFTVRAPASKRAVSEVFGGADWTDRLGEPVRSFEHISELPDHSLQIEAVEGHGTMTPQASFPLRFTGRTQDDAAAFTLTYELAGTSLHRVATHGGAVVDDEHCTREPDPAPTTCPQPNVPARVVHAAEPGYPPEAYPTRAKGLVQVRVVLDDRSRLLWTDIQSSTNPVFDESARQAARETTYRTQVRNCRPIPAVYIFTVDYSP
jgi:Gram-negative bacterial TonB protein C-terminal